MCITTVCIYLYTCLYVCARTRTHTI